MQIIKTNRKRWTLMIISFVLIITSISVDSMAQANPERVFYGRQNAAAILANLDYADVKDTGTWAMDAIWETGALELMKGYGAKRFGLKDTLTVEQAIAIAYNMAGREAEAQLAAQALDLLRTSGDRKVLAPQMWSDGYLQLAFNDELITQDEYADAFTKNQQDLRAGDFRRSDAVTREDMAFYIAKVLLLTPVNAQTHLFNSYSDWQSANPHRIPYIEAIIQNRVMNGNNGSFDPKGVVTREQAAQIIQNAEPFLFTRLNMEKLKGIIEKISEYTDKSDGKATLITQIHVRSSDGALHQFKFSWPSGSEWTNEISGSKGSIDFSGAIVNEKGVLKNETALVEGQVISYIVRNGQVQYIAIVEDQKKTDYVFVRVNQPDSVSRVIVCDMLLSVPFSDIRLIKPESILKNSAPSSVNVLSFSNDAIVIIDFEKKTFNDIKPDTFYLATLENGVITKMELVKLNLEEEGMVNGILEENNPVLGYLTLYFPDGSGISAESAASLSTHRTYSWLNPANVIVQKNGKTAQIEDLKPGDSVFLKLDTTGYITQISGADNFYPVYGRVRTKGNGTLQMEKQDGTVEQIRIPLDTPIFKERKRVTWSTIHEGDNIRVFLQTAGNTLVVGEITIEKENTETNGIFKALFTGYDAMGKTLVVSGLQQFKDGIWRPAPERGIVKLPMNENYRPDIPKGAQGTVYMAMGESVSGKETVVRLALDNESIVTDVLKGTIIQVQPGLGTLPLLDGNAQVFYDDSALIVRSGKLLDTNQVKSRDEAYIAAGSLIDGSIRANVVWLQEDAVDTGLVLLRGRISQIDAQRSLTLQSFSQFRSPDWEFTNAPKTLSIDPAVTRIFDDDGRTDSSEFDDTGANSYKNRTVYVLAQDGKAMLISTAPFGDSILRGRIKSLSGMQKDTFGHTVTPPVSVLINEMVAYNPNTSLWESKPELEMNLPSNVVVMKNGLVIDAGLLEASDRITVIRSNQGTNALVIMAESW